MRDPMQAFCVAAAAGVLAALAVIVLSRGAWSVLHWFIS